MFKKIILAIYIFSSLKSTAQTVDEILNQYEIKNGGKEKFAAITTLQYSGNIKMQMMGMPMNIGVANFIETGKLYRKELSGMFGLKGAYTLVTDTAGYTFSPTIPSYGDFQGMEGGIKKMENNVFLENKNKLNAMEEFSTLIDCKSKGFIPEFVGMATVEKVNCYKIKLTAKDGLIATYFIDATTYLLKQVELLGKQMMDKLGLNGGPLSEMMGGNINKQKMAIIYVEYAEINGIKFPTKQKLQLGAVDVEIENSEIQLNEPIDKKWYTN